jgi:nuclear transport factor 2 (NTF2) superfamily protein
MARPPLPPFTETTAIQKVRMAEGAWNTCYHAPPASLASRAGFEPALPP